MYVYTHTHIYIYVCMYVLHINVYVYPHTHTHIYIYINREFPKVDSKSQGGLLIQKDYPQYKAHLYIIIS